MSYLELNQNEKRNNEFDSCFYKLKSYRSVLAGFTNQPSSIRANKVC